MKHPKKRCKCDGWWTQKPICAFSRKNNHALCLMCKGYLPYDARFDSDEFFELTLSYGPKELICQECK
jgi:hypothetical protein